MLCYYLPFKYKGFTASCDSVVLDGKLHFTCGDKLTAYISNLDCGIKIDYWQSFKIGCFRHLWTIHFTDDISCTLQLSFNDGKKPNDKIRLDYNPNKCNSNLDFIKFHNFVVGCCKFLDLKRWDLALDYPVERENCFLIKDQRKYREEKYSNSDKTQYLGIRSHGGFVKLYNKQIESKLKLPLTRLELTVDGLSSYEALNIPLVYVLDDRQMKIDGLKLTDTDRFILNALLCDMGTIDMLGRYQRDKMKRVISSYTHTLDIDTRTYYDVLHVAKSQCNYLEHIEVIKPQQALRFDLVDDVNNEIGKLFED